MSLPLNLPELQKVEEARLASPSNFTNIQQEKDTTKESLHLLQR